MAFSIMTQNCYGVPLLSSVKRLQIIASKIKELQPDVVFLQEIQWRGFVEIFNLPNYELFFENGLYATKGGLLTLVKTSHRSKHLSFQKFISQGKLFSPQVLCKILGKGFLRVYLKQLDLHLINTHLAADYPNIPLNDRTYDKQLFELLKRLKKYKRVILAGDFNLDEKSTYYNEILKRGYKDFTYGLGPSYPESGEKIDFIFGKNVKNFSKRGFIDYKIPVSDHKGILVS